MIRNAGFEAAIGMEYDYDIVPADVQVINDEPETVLSDEQKALKLAIESLFSELNITRSHQLTMINRYDGHGKLENITEQGLGLMLNELKEMRQGMHTEADAEVLDAGTVVGGADGKKENS